MRLRCGPAAASTVHVMAACRLCARSSTSSCGRRSAVGGWRLGVGSCATVRIHGAWRQRVRACGGWCGWGVPPHPPTPDSPSVRRSCGTEATTARSTCGGGLGTIGFMDYWCLKHGNTVLLLETLPSKVFTGRVSSFQGFFNCLPMASKIFRVFQMVYRLKI